jgi:hypothetical protein
MGKCENAIGDIHWFYMQNTLKINVFIQISKLKKPK